MNPVESSGTQQTKYGSQQQGAPTHHEIQENLQRFDEILEQARAGSAANQFTEGLNSLENPSGLDYVASRPQTGDYDNTLGVSLNERFKFNMDLISTHISQLQLQQQGPPIPAQFQQDIQDFTQGRPFTDEELDLKVGALSSYSVSMHYIAQSADSEIDQQHAYMKMDFVMMAQVKIMKTYDNSVALDAMIDDMQRLEVDENPNARELLKKQTDFFVNMLQGTPAKIGDAKAPLLIQTNDISSGLLETLKMRLAMSLDYSTSSRSIYTQLSPELQSELDMLSQMEAADEAEEEALELEEEMMQDELAEKEASEAKSDSVIS